MPITILDFDVSQGSVLNSLWIWKLLKLYFQSQSTNNTLLGIVYLCTYIHILILIHWLRTYIQTFIYMCVSANIVHIFNAWMHVFSLVGVYSLIDWVTVLFAHGYLVPTTRQHDNHRYINVVKRKQNVWFPPLATYLFFFFCCLLHFNKLFHDSCLEYIIFEICLGLNIFSHSHSFRGCNPKLWSFLL